MIKTEIPFLTVAELSELIREKTVSPVEATEAYLDRIDSLNFKFNSYITVARKEALESARDAEQAIARGDYIGPMHGIPVAVKDQLWSKGIRTTVGSRFMADFVPDEDATALANLKKAGYIHSHIGGGGHEAKPYRCDRQRQAQLHVDGVRRRKGP